MRQLILCAERLQRLQTVLSRHSGTLSLRDLSRCHGIWGWEVEQAADLGWVRIVTSKPRVGRPSRVAEIVSDYCYAKLPPNRWEIPTNFKFRHWRFALECCSVRGGSFTSSCVPTAAEAYRRVFPYSRSAAGARASSSRLMKRSDVRLMIYWFRQLSPYFPREPMPDTFDELASKIQELTAPPFRF